MSGEILAQLAAALANGKIRAVDLSYYAEVVEAGDPAAARVRAAVILCYTLFAYCLGIVGAPSAKLTPAVEPQTHAIVSNRSPGLIGITRLSPSVGSWRGRGGLATPTSAGRSRRSAIT
jgi:hypothetical protein